MKEAQYNIKIIYPDHENVDYHFDPANPLLTAKTLPIPEMRRDVKDPKLISYTKHYYIGSERITSVIGSKRGLGAYPGQSETTVPLNLVEDIVDAAGTAVQAAVAHFGKTIVLPQPFRFSSGLYNGSDLQDPENYAAFWYHPDHLGSSSYITNLAGGISQHMEYLPFGETLIEEHMNSNNSPYKFNAKELDAETGNYYYGARYYDPKYNLMLSVDPALEMYPGISPYAYTLQNPVRYVDPTGMFVESPDDWIWDKDKEKYVWDGNVTGEGNTPEGFEYVGPSIKNVEEHHKENNPISSIFSSPKLGEDRTPWPGEISERESTIFEKARDFGIENNIPFSETAYNMADDVTAFVTSFDLLNPVGHPLRLDGSNSIRGSEDHINSSINGLISVTPLPKFSIRGFNMAQSNSFFKGTKFNQLSPQVKGKVVSTFNSLMKKVVTPKMIIKQVKSILE